MKSSRQINLPEPYEHKLMQLTKSHGIVVLDRGRNISTNLLEYRIYGDSEIVFEISVMTKGWVADFTLYSLEIDEYTDYIRHSQVTPTIFAA